MKRILLLTLLVFSMFIHAAILFSGKTADSLIDADLIMPGSGSRIGD